MQSLYRSPTNGRKAINRIPALRQRLREGLMSRLRQEVKEKELQELLTKQEFGKTKLKRVRKPKVINETA